MYSRGVIYFSTFETSSARGERKFQVSARVSPKNVSLFFRGRGPLTRGAREVVLFLALYTEQFVPLIAHQKICYQVAQKNRKEW